MKPFLGMLVLFHILFEIEAVWRSGQFADRYAFDGTAK
jgi:hypothetical protein